MLKSRFLGLAVAAALFAGPALAGNYAGVEVQVNALNSQTAVATVNADASYTTTPGYWSGPWWNPTWNPSTTTLDAGTGVIKGIEASATSVGNLHSIDAGAGDNVLSGTIQLNGLNGQTAVGSLEADIKVKDSSLDVAAIGNEFDVTGKGNVATGALQINALNSQTAVATVTAPTIKDTDVSSKAIGNAQNLSGANILNLGVQANLMNSQTAVTGVQGLSISGGSASALAAGSVSAVRVK